MLWLAELEPVDGNAYIDPVHYSPVFAKLIGETLAKRVVEMLPVPPSPEIGTGTGAIPSVPATQ